MQWSHPVGIWVGAIGTLALFSLIFRENRLYRLFEHMFIGLAAGYTIKAGWHEILRPQWWDPMTKQGQWPWVFALFGGLLFYTIFTKRYAWMSRISIGVLLGFASGQAFQSFANLYIPQIRGSFKPLWVDQSMLPRGATVTPLGQSLNNILFVLIIVTVMTYFLFSFEHRNKVVTGTARIGRLMLMFAFGAIFGSTVMARMALLIDRVWFLMNTWLHIGGQG